MVSLTASRNPGAGGTTPMFAGIGSAITAAGRPLKMASTTASSSFQGTITVSEAWASVTPGLAGAPAVASPDPPSASSPSTWPW